MRALIAGGCVLLLAGALGLAACGGDDDDALTKAEFIKQADAICKKGDQEIEKAAEGNEALSGNQRPSQAEIVKFSEDTVIPNVQGQIDQLRDLSPPSDDEDQVNAILDEAQEAIDLSKDDPASLAGNSDPFKKANQLAQDYGLTECGGD